MALVFNPLGRETNFNFLSLRRVTLAISAVLVACSILLFFAPGLNLGVDFKGGTQVTLPAQGPSLTDMQQTINAAHPHLAGVEVQAFGDTNARFIIPQPTATDLADSGGLAEGDFIALRLNDALSALGIAGDDQSVSDERVGGQVSGEQQWSAIWAISVALIAIGLYIAVRFEWRFSLAALTALLHDAITTIGLFALLGLEVNLEVVAAVLTIAGYSINDTVVVFDRIREEMRRSPDEPLIDLLNRSLNRTLSRTVMTSVTTLLALLMLFFFAGADLLSFSVALIWGVLVGTYSSVFLATPMLKVLNLSSKVFERKQLDVDGIEDAALAWASTVEDTSVESLEGETVAQGSAPKRTKGKPRKGKKRR